MIFRRKKMRWSLPILLILALAHPLSAAKMSQKLVILNERVGPVIDRQENQRFHLFNRDIGLIAVKLYFTSTRKWMLHLAGKLNGGYWMQTVRLSSTLKQKLQARLESRAGKGEESSMPVFTEPVYEVSASDSSDEQLRSVTLLDKTTFVGYIKHCTPDTLRFETLNGLAIEIADAQILEVRVPEGKLVGSTFLRFDPNDTRLFFGPTGRTLKAGEAAMSDFYVVFPTFSVGITDQFMFGGGVSLVPGADRQLFYVSPKLRLMHRQDLDWAAGLLYVGVPGEGGIGTAFTSLTIGNPLGGVSIGMAVPFYPHEDDDDFRFAGVLLGAEKQVSNHLKLITENWIFTTDEIHVLISGGVRFIGNGLTVGFGFFNNPEFSDEGFPLIPWLDFSISFGR